MRKLFLVLLAVLFLAGTALAATSGNRTSPGRGEIVQMPFQSDPPKKFRLVRWVGTGSNAVSADSIVVWDTTIDDGVTVNTTAVSYDSSVAGILVTAGLAQDTSGNTAVQDIGKDNWAWLQTYGLSQVNLSPTSAACSAGSAMGTSTYEGEAGVLKESASSSTGHGFAGFFFDASVLGADDVEVFVRTE